MTLDLFVILGFCRYYQTRRLTRNACHFYVLSHTFDVTMARITLFKSASLSSQVVDEANVYACTGYPTPREMRTLLQWCLNEPLSVAFKSAFWHCIPPLQVLLALYLASRPSLMGH